MKKNKKVSINKLRKTHIWPSVVFLLFSYIISMISSLWVLAASLANLAHERIDATCLNASFISSSLDAVSGNEPEVLGNIQSEPVSPEAIYVLDEKNNVIAGYGEQSYILDSTFDSIAELYSGNKYSFCGDTTNDNIFDIGENNIIDENGTLRKGKILELINSKNINYDNIDSNSVLFKIKFWAEFELSGSRTALIKIIVPIYAKDLENSLITTSVISAVMLLPIVFLFINVIINVHNQRRMTKLLYTDVITGGNSYTYFEHAAGKALRSKVKAKKSFVIADVTIEKYRSYCNYHGIRSGEKLLEDANKQIQSYMGKNEFCAHSGKSSFVLFMKSQNKEADTARVTNMINELSEKFSHGGIVFHAGIYFSKPHTSKNGKKISSRRITDPADCFNLASAARATLTDENTPSVAVYNYKLLEEQMWEHKVEEKMQAALDNEEFQVYIQPKYDPVTEKLAGAEALVRWVNDEDGFISPGKFIPIFEKNGFITQLDDYMLAHVAEFQAEWIREGKSVVPVSVNVSRAHFANPNLADHICSIVDKYDVPHNVIEIELTESAFFDDKNTLLNTVGKLHSLGFEISMDDFGSGYSSLNSLKDLPLDVLKLDAEFFRGEDEENRGEVVVSQAITLAKKLNMRIVAEGVEKKEQVDFLAGQGCDMIQGFYFAKPMPADEYAQRLK